jgi:hypothetical protein
MKKYFNSSLILAFFSLAVNFVISKIAGRPFRAINVGFFVGCIILGYIYVLCLKNIMPYKKRIYVLVVYLLVSWIIELFIRQEFLFTRQEFFLSTNDTNISNSIGIMLVGLMSYVLIAFWFIGLGGKIQLKFHKKKETVKKSQK